MNIFGSLMGQFMNNPSFAGLNAPKKGVDRGIPEGMNPGARNTGRYMSQANDLSGVFPQPVPDLPGLGVNASAPYTDVPSAAVPPPVSAPKPPALSQMQNILGSGVLGSMGPIGSVLAAKPAPKAAPKPAPKPIQKPAPKKATKPSLPPQFMYGTPFMGMNRFMF